MSPSFGRINSKTEPNMRSFTVGFLIDMEKDKVLTERCA